MIGDRYMNRIYRDISMVSTETCGIFMGDSWCRSGSKVSIHDSVEKVVNSAHFVAHYIAQIDAEKCSS